MTSKCAWRKRARRWQRRHNKEFVCHSFWYTEAGKWMRQHDGLLAWQRGVREAWAAYDAEDEVEASTLDRLRQAIESEPKEET